MATPAPATAPAPSTSPVDDLLRVVGKANLVTDRHELKVYECDGFPVAKGQPLAVVFPTTTRQVADVVKVLCRHGIEIVPRGSGTGLAGGCVAFDRGVIVSTSRMKTIESIDIDNRVAVAQAGVLNTKLSDAVAVHCKKQWGPDSPVLHFSPDPSSQKASTVGGNASTNAGGINTLKHGVTANHILGLEFVTPDGEVHRSRADLCCDGLGPDLPGLLCGSEGLLGIITRLWCRLVPRPAHFRTVYAVFNTTADACHSVSDVIASGITPTSMEMMDGAMIRVVEDAFHYGFPTTAQALLLLEIDGVNDVLDDQMQRVVEQCENNNATDIKQCSDPQRRAELWSARKRAFGAIGRISNSYCTQDACVPRSKLPEVMERVSAIGEQYGLKITNVFHAGDGNIHPILLFDEDDPDDVQRTLQASEEILSYCIGVGGALTGEHGVGVEKLHLMPVMFNPATLQTFTAIKRAFDPDGRINEGKLLPSDRVEIELMKHPAPSSPGGAMAHL